MDTHHAIITFSQSIVRAAVPEAYKQQSADVHHLVRESLSIADARELTLRAHRMPVAAQVQVFVVQAATLTLEAQNALLKLFEDPPARTQFFLVVPQEGMVLPTLLSRMMRVDSVQENTSDHSQAEAFITASVAQRLALVAALAKDKDTQKIESLLAGLEAWAHGDFAARQQTVHALMLVRPYIGMRGASTKMLLEELALSLP